MLDTYIIEEIKRQEEARRRSESDARPSLRIERGRPPARPRDETDITPGEQDRGVIRIDIDQPTIRIGT